MMCVPVSVRVQIGGVGVQTEDHAEVWVHGIGGKEVEGEETWEGVRHCTVRLDRAIPVHGKGCSAKVK